MALFDAVLHVGLDMVSHGLRGLPEPTVEEMDCLVRRPSPDSARFDEG